MTRLCGALLVGMLSLGWPAPAAATPGEGVQGRVLVQSTGDGQDFVTKELTIAPGGSTGWHWHPGQVYGVIRSGTLTHYSADCSVDGTYPAGSAITETVGPGYVHEGRNLGPDPLVMWVGYIVPAGSPLANSVDNPGCPFK
ncbi:cupin domain-containing protein [Mycolicibacterium sp. PDY-3]|uniref:cupin domain-containing protein n=1 Tax=Mycolicibacterium sp. PDY-3 TaxID=3376069 RepID=UPI00378FD0C5